MTDHELNRVVDKEVIGYPHANKRWVLDEYNGVRTSRQEYREIPRYCTDIAAAWQVVEKMRECGWSVTIGQHIDLSWRCKFTDDETLIEIIAQGDTAPRAICLAALEAIEEHK
jgi:hypothetical protein